MAANTIIPPTNFNFSTPIIYVDIYSANRTANQSITLTPTNSGLMNLTVQKYLRGDNNSGRFSFTLAPGGTSGVNASTSWTSILTQYSLCVIYGSRGNSRAIIMVGLISSVKETQVWNNNSVRRLIEVQGFDFTLYLNTFAYYVLAYLGLQYTLSGNFGPAGTTIIADGGDIEGSPAKVGTNWFHDEFLGFAGAVKSGVLQNTTITYQGNNIPLYDIFTYWFEEYTTPSNTAIIIPVLTNFLISEGTFYDKFIQIFPFPFYELFVNTVPHNYYPKAVAPITTIGTQIPGFVTADIVAVGRVNPLPTVDVMASGQTYLRRDRWDGLNLYNLAPYSFIESQVEYNIDDIKNFYVISPMGPLTQPGGEPSNLAPAIEQIGYMFDQASIAKYGFRSNVESLIWWVDPLGTVAASSMSLPSGVAIPSEIQYQSFLYKSASYYEATPNMLHGSIKIPMWPEVIVGNQFQYYPFKNTVPYTFYITGIEHEFNYGKESFTTLYLERGLPSNIYSGNDTLLLQIHLGQAERVNGQIVANTSTGLIYANLATTDSFSSFPGALSLGSPESVPPASTNNSYDSTFESAIVLTATPCQTNPVFNATLLKALGMTESTPALDQTSTNMENGNTYYGIMQVTPSSAPPGYNDPVQLKNNAVYNINAGAQVLCGKLQAAGGSMLNALTAYKSTFSNYNTATPQVQSEVNAVLTNYYGLGGYPAITN